MATGSGGAYLRALPPHANWHESGGIDEVNITDLSGVSTEDGIESGARVAADAAEAAARILADAAHAALTSGTHGLVGYLAFKVNRTVDQLINNNTLTRVQWNQEVYDIGSDFNIGTYEWTAPITCTLRTNCSIRWAAAPAASYQCCYIYRVGHIYPIATLHYNYNEDNSLQVINGSADIRVTAGWRLFMQVFQLSGGNINIRASDYGSWWAGYILPQSG